MTDLPVANLHHAVPHLRRPFTPEAIRWKVQATWGKSKDGPRTGGMVVPYIDARLVAERLDAVVPGLWSDHASPVQGNGNAMICYLDICGMERSGVGESTHSLKAAESDALKRAGVKFGVGACIYAMNRVMLDASADGSMKGTGATARPTLKQTKPKGKDSAELTDEATEWLRGMYARWIATPKIVGAFGEPLDHGDTSETLGLEGADVRPPDTDPELEAAVLEVQHLYDSLTQAQRKGLSRDKFGQQLRGVSTDSAKLEKLRAEIEERAK